MNNSKAYSKVQAEPVLETERQYEKADISVAEQYRKKQMVTDENGAEYEICTDMTEFKSYGVGLKLFFDFMRLSAIIFWIMALLSIPAIYSNLMGGGLAVSFQQSANGIAATTIANQPQLVYESGSTTEEQEEAYNEWEEEMSKNIYWVAAPDLAYTVVFLIFIWIFSNKSKDIKREIDQETAQPKQFTVQVDNLHPEFKNPEILAQHFSQFGEVCGVYFAKNYNGMLSYYTKSSQIIHKIKQEEKRLESKKQAQPSSQLKSLKKDLAQLQAKIDKINQEELKGVSSNQDFPTLYAFVTFNTLEAKEKCIRIYENAWSLCGDRPESLKIQGTTLPYIVKKVDNPSNIKWENLDASGFERFFRFLCVALILLLTMIFTLAIVFVANVVKPTSSQECPVSEISRADATASDASDLVVNCFCLKQSLDSIYQDDELTELCEDTLYDYFLNIGFSVGTALVVVIVNAILKSVISALSSFSRYKNLTQQVLSTTEKLFVSMYINSAIISTLLTAEIEGVSPARNVSDQLFQYLETQNAKYYADFDREWYTTVGTKIIFSTIALIVSPHLTNVIFTPCYRCMRTRKARQQVLQSDMNEFITGPTFDVTQYYAIALNMIFITLTYCSAMPIMLFMCALSLTFQYWSYKYLFLRYNKRPPTYDTSLNNSVVSILPYGIAIHILVGIYMYGNSSLFPKSSLSITDDVASQGSSVETNEGLYSRITQNPISIILFILVVLMIALFVLNRSVFLLFKGLYRTLCFCCKSKKVKNYQFSSYKEEAQNISKRMIATYNIMENEIYSKLISAMESKSHNF